ncbi:hypothetical protein TVAG_219770 [Trichomonas vaginalis G3]|uniref:L-dopachrome isomerase n=1 Tax=Trichomonas vaginalis (strain ATCC PRA-98 / G3) TaxID=412133 RepID=A2DXT4_TRIV3|nr:phenylpyruvate tautomerase protein [Trichomonas vaginalis G3]EAY14794.1 hypothetical protein TVAG_219770 [Trichomonas vaginalis G3]KAI5508069.1 phenylpyruvate tautomerase protein [Trichomonas vaginalis G3]|eukprot:XP_001327017.1 hypothetical protein [Trichomonas vaginalis G3]
MPALVIKTNAKFTEEEKSKATEELGNIVSKVLGKPISYVMVTLEDGVAVRFGGSDEKAAFMSLMSIGGLNRAVNKRASAALTKWFTDHGFQGDRIYIVFNPKSAEDWGFNGDTFA